MRHTALFIIFVLALSACAQQENTIGGLFCQTGYASFAGESSRDGFLLAIADAQARGDDVAYKIEDCQSDFTKTVTAARKLIDVDGANVIIGPEWEFGAAVSPIAADGDALFLSPWLTLDQSWTDPALFMSAMPREQVYTDAFAAWMSAQGMEKVAFVGSIDDFASLVERTTRTAFDREGIELVEAIAVSGDQEDFRTQVLRLKQLDADAVFIVFAQDADEARFVRQARELGLDKRLLIHYARAESNGFLDACGDACEGTVFASPRAPARSAAFAEKFRAHYGREPTAPSAATAYDATTAVIAAFDAGATAPEDVHAFLENYSADGFSGPFVFDDGFIAGGAATVKKIENGTRIVIG